MYVWLVTDIDQTRRRNETNRIYSMARKQAEYVALYGSTGQKPL